MMHSIPRGGLALLFLPLLAAAATATPIDSAAVLEVSAVGDTLTAPLEVASDSATARPFDYVWVLRSTLTRRSSIDSVVARARAMGVRGLLVQVVGRGDAYYRSDLLPRAESLTFSDSPEDPLGELLVRAHDAGLEVHAWMNCLLVWSGPRRPRDPRHVVNAHPEWVAELPDGRRMTQLTPRDYQRLGVEGAFLTPGHPGVRTWIARIATEIVRRYPVDGIHLDYIRQPDATLGYDPTTRARFALQSGVDVARRGTVPRAERAALDSAWAGFQREQVQAIVREVRDSIGAVRGGVMLSAAVIADTLRAERTTAQFWRGWIQDGLLDRAFLMCYASSAQTVMDQLVALVRQFGASDRVVPGIAVFNTSATIAALKIAGARALGFPLLALYSYDSLFENPIRWERLRAQLEPRRSPERPGRRKT
jgi:uncharacterized lipoprotein YddW (UPF0748 family)